jgi:integrase
VTLAAYTKPWLADRTLKPRTRDHYQHLLDRLILPILGDRPLKAITPVVVRTWHADLGSKTPTLRAHAYALLRTILGSAVHDGLIAANPCHIRGGGNSKRVHKIKPLTLPELERLVSHMPDHLKLLVLLAAWCGLRFGELTELRRSDIDLKNGRIKIRRAVVHVNGKAIVGVPKSDAGIRDVAIPPHLLPIVKAHCRACSVWAGWSSVSRQGWRPPSGVFAIRSGTDWDSRRMGVLCRTRGCETARPTLPRP